MSRGDPTIPRKRIRAGGTAAEGTAVAGPRTGWFVDMGNGDVRLTDMAGNRWRPEFVRMVSGSFGSDTDGFQRAPRTRLYNPDGSVAREGDFLLIFFLEDDPAKPVVMGGVRTLKPVDTGFFSSQAIGQDPGPARLRMSSDRGHLQLRMLDGGAKVEVEVGGGAFGDGLRLIVDHDAGTISFGRDDATHPIPLGDAMAEAIKGLADDIVAVNAAVATGIPVPVLAATQVTIDASTSLAAEGAPLLSAILRAE